MKFKDREEKELERQVEELKSKRRKDKLRAEMGGSFRDMKEFTTWENFKYPLILFGFLSVFISLILIIIGKFNLIFSIYIWLIPSIINFIWIEGIARGYWKDYLDGNKPRRKNKEKLSR